MMTSDDPLRDAARRLHQLKGGTVPNPGRTRERVLELVARRRRRRQRWTVGAMALAGLLVVSGAWGAGTGRIPLLWRAVTETVAPRRPSAPAAAPKSIEVTPLPVPSVPVESPLATSTPAPLRTLTEAPRRRVDSARRRETTSPPLLPRADPQPVPDHEEQLFKTAYREHFVTRDPRAALEGWDAYLAAAPSGRYALEASYNRALCLVRLGRRTDAAAALRPFADGTHGDYRRRDASRLIGALTPGETP